MKILILIFYLIKLSISISLQFSNSLQRFVYDDVTDTIILASVNHIYSLNGSNLSILSDIDTSLSSSKIDQDCSIKNKSSLSKSLYYFSTSSYLTPSINNTFNQLLLLTNNGTILICSTSNRGRSCQLRSLINLDFMKNSSQRVVSSSPFLPSVGLINKNNQILYISNTYDSVCDPFYEIPTISGRHLVDNDFLSIINLNSGQSALQQSTYTLRLLNIRLIRDFFLYYLYAFEYKHFSYFLTIQQSDIHHTRKHKLQTKILRFCQTLKQPIIKSYVELPLTCGKDYHYLVRAKFSNEKKILYGLFRNTTSANSSSTSHAICSYSIDTIQEAFFQTIKRCLVDGKGHRGLDFISPDTHCIPSNNLNQMNHDYCPDENDRFFQYPIGGHRSIEQIEPIIELYDRVNFTAIEIGSNEKDTIILIGDDNGTVHTFQTSNTNETYKQSFQSKIIVDLKLINTIPTLKDAKLIVLTENQIIKQNLSTCEQYTTCNECSTIPRCHWCSRENRCTATFECEYENQRTNRINMCAYIEQVIPQTISLNLLNIELQVKFNVPLRSDTDEYMCRFTFKNGEQLYRTNASLNHNIVKCFPPVLNNINQAIYNVVLSIEHVKRNVTFGSSSLIFLNCSNVKSCSSCALYSNLCLWNRETVKCIFQQNDRFLLSDNQSLSINSQQCPFIYLQQSRNRLAYHVDKTFIVHIEQCNQSVNISSCYLYDHRKRFSLFESNPVLIRSVNENNLCLLICSFQWSNSKNFNQISFHRPLNLYLSIQFSNKTISMIPHTPISLYHCEHMALNCTSCLQLDPSYECTWCNNMCMFKNQSRTCSTNSECLMPIIHTIEPLILPMNGGTLVTMKGKYFDLFGLSIQIADVPCQLIEQESSTNKIVCQSGDAGSTFRAGMVRLKFGLHGPQISSHETISYINPKINSIEPLIGIQSGGTVLTISGENFIIGNSHLSVFIGNRSCQLLSISSKKIECETRSFPRSMLNENQTINILFDRQTKLIYKYMFTIVPNPILYGFDKNSQYRSFVSGGHEVIVLGENFHIVQNIQLEFRQFIFVSPLYQNNTHLVFLTPSIEELNLYEQQKVEIKIYLDNFNKTSSLIYIDDPMIYELEPMLQPYASELTIQGINLTSVGHTKNHIVVQIGCDLCTVIHLQADKIICQPPRYRPEKYSKAKRLCYNSEHPSIIVTIDNIRAHVGFMIYPKKLIILGVLSGCLFTIVFIVLIIIMIVSLKIRFTQRRSCKNYFCTNSIIPHGVQQETPYLITNSLSAGFRIRSYVNYLQLCYYYNHLSSNKKIFNFKQETMDQYKFLLGNNEQLIDFLFKLSIKSNNKNILNNLILTQRYNLKKLFKYNHPLIYYNICILTSYDTFLINPIHSLLSQIYSQLKFKLYNGPIDAIEQTISYYSLNIDTILQEYSIQFKNIQLTVHIDFNSDKNSNELLLNITCLTCDTISQVKTKILYELNSMNPISINESKLYLLTNHSCSSSSSSSSTASSSVPLARKSMLTKVLYSRSIKYSTTIINDTYRDSCNLLLNDIDNTSEQIHNAKKLNTLQHYGINSDGYELKLVLSIKQMNHADNSFNLINTFQKSCHYCSLTTCNDKIMFNYLTSPPLSNIDTLLSYDRTHYIHLLNHTYEEIDSELGQSLINNNNHDETFRLFETKAMINSLLINLIETLFKNLIHNDTFFNELMEQYSPVCHQYYAHFIPFIFQNIDCLLDVSIDKCLNNSLSILSMIFQIACCQQAEQECLLCNELLNSKNSNSTIQNCTLLFADEIQRVRLHYSNLEQSLKDKASSSEYSSTNIGIDKKFELDDSIFHDLFEYSCSHADQIIEHLKSQSSDTNALSIFLSLIKQYRSMELT
ncbi:unnamed protein product [Rotaria socialis]|uniref:Sema domain-containing protein n=3 Tax=Rotaria socialis TaxID=392032 RepID=A0A818CGK4_9BILA|nr:unnamed protein product [Rotaria socialis]